MDDQDFLIIKINPETVSAKESLGSKEKFWYRPTEDSSQWLFKFADENTGQHWSEKIAEQVADKLDILHARVELAIFNTYCGSTTESFARDGRSLFHGNQILAGSVFGYNPKKQFGQSAHTLNNIFLALENVFSVNDTAKKAKAQFAGYLILDAIIGNTDRHHENWGVLRKQVGDHWQGYLAPTFDHASSLGRELRDETMSKTSRADILNRHRVGAYSEKAPGAIYWNEEDGRGLSPLQLVRLASEKYPDLMQSSMAKLERLDYNKLKDIISRVPPTWMSDLARDFALQLMCYNISELKKVKL